MPSELGHVSLESAQCSRPLGHDRQLPQLRLIRIRRRNLLPIPALRFRQVWSCLSDTVGIPSHQGSSQIFRGYAGVRDAALDAEAVRDDDEVAVPSRTEDGLAAFLSIASLIDNCGSGTPL